MEEKNEMKWAPFGTGLVITHLIILVIAFGLLLFNQWAQPNEIATVAKEVAFALIISLVVIYSLELAAKKRYEETAMLILDRVHKGIFNAVYKKNIPEAIFSEFDRTVINATCYREGLEVTYDFREADEPELVGDFGYVCDVTLTYELVNASSDVATTVPIELSLEKPVEYEHEKHSEYVKVTAVQVGRDNPHHLNGEDIRNRTTIGKNHIHFSHKQDLSGGERVFIQMTCCLLKKERDVEVWASRIPSTDMTLTVLTPAHVKVHASANHSMKLQSSVDGAKHQRWVLKGGVLPHQSVLFWWGGEKQAQQDKGPSRRGL